MHYNMVKKKKCKRIGCTNRVRTNKYTFCSEMCREFENARLKAEKERKEYVAPRICEREGCNNFLKEGSKYTAKYCSRECSGLDTSVERNKTRHKLKAERTAATVKRKEIIVRVPEQLHDCLSPY